MRSSIFIMMLAGITMSCQQQDSTIIEEEPPFHDGINWQGENEIANYLAIEGIWHWMNAEIPVAYTLFEKAVELDSSLFACHTALAMLSSGEKSEYHKGMAKQYVENENETSKLFVSFLDIPTDSTGVDKRREVWAKMHELSNGPFIHYRYALSRTDTLVVLDELDKLENFLTELNFNSAHINNVRGYVLQSMGKLPEGTAEIEKYMEKYPNGYNPLDSRAEFYLFAGDTAMAIDYYQKTLNRFPFSTSAANTLQELTGK